jgi:hypothetical protein
MYRYILLISMLYFAASCKSDPTTIDANAYEEQKQSIAEKEKTKPLVFLHVKSSHRKNWIGQTVVEGTLSNSAAVSSYKDVRLKMLCFDKNDKMVEEHEDMLDVILKPNSNKDFKLRYRLPRSTDSIAVSVMGAAMHE